MQATTASRSASRSPPRSVARFRTVEDEVNVTASIAPGADSVEHLGRWGGGRRGEVERDLVDRCACCAQALDERRAGAFGARDEHP